jgi:hypothetical protein
MFLSDEGAAAPSSNPFATLHYLDWLGAQRRAIEIIRLERVGSADIRAKGALNVVGMIVVCGNPRTLAKIGLEPGMVALVDEHEMGVLRLAQQEAMPSTEKWGSHEHAAHCIAAGAARELLSSRPEVRSTIADVVIAQCRAMTVAYERLPLLNMLNAGMEAEVKP